jgi:hypothetical protein
MDRVAAAWKRAAAPTGVGEEDPGGRDLVENDPDALARLRSVSCCIFMGRSTPWVPVSSYAARKMRLSRR